MQIEQSPIFRKSCAPWYDSNTACFIAAFAMAAIIFFGITGIGIAAVHPGGLWLICMPVLLVLLSAAVCASILVRLVRRKMAEG